MKSYFNYFYPMCATEIGFYYTLYNNKIVFLLLSPQPFLPFPITLSYHTKPNQTLPRLLNQTNPNPNIPDP